MGKVVKLEGVTVHTLLNFLTYLFPSPMPKNVAEKLMIKEGQRFLLLKEPSNYRGLVGRLPNKVKISTEAKGQYDVIQVFVASKNELNQRLPKLKTSLASDGIIWVTYPKGTSKRKTDINRDSIREYAQTIGLEADAIFSVDDDWSALRMKAA